MQHAAVADLLVHLGRENADRAARLLLGAEQRRAGIGEQRSRVRAVMRKYRDAGGDAGAHRLAVDREFVRHRLRELFGQRLAGLRLLAVDDQAELVAREPGHPPPRAEAWIDQRPRSGLSPIHSRAVVGSSGSRRDACTQLPQSVRRSLDHPGRRLRKARDRRSSGLRIGCAPSAIRLAAIGDVLVVDRVLRLRPRRVQSCGGSGKPAAILGEIGCNCEAGPRFLITPVARDQPAARIEDVGGGRPVAS